MLFSRGGGGRENLRIRIKPVTINPKVAKNMGAAHDHHYMDQSLVPAISKSKFQFPLRDIYYFQESKYC